MKGKNKNLKARNALLLEYFKTYISLQLSYFTMCRNLGKDHTNRTYEESWWNER